MKSVPLETSTTDDKILQPEKIICTNTHHNTNLNKNET